MTKRDLLAVAMRLLGVTIFIDAIVAMPQIISFLSEPRVEGLLSQRTTLLWATGSYIILMSVAGVILMACADGISRSMMREDAILEWPEWLCDKSALFDFGARVYGLVLLAKSIPLLAAAIWERFSAGDINIQVARSSQQSIVTSIVSVCIGVVLIVGVGRIIGSISNVLGMGKKALEGPDV